MEGFWQISGVVLQVLQMAWYVIQFNNYRDRLDDLSDRLAARAKLRFDQYKKLRDKDPDFYAYYEALPDYEICEDDIKRARGAAAAQYGARLRNSLKTVPGYQQLARVSIVGGLAEPMVHTPTLSRAQSMIKERSHVDDHVLQRWQAIVSAPVNTQHTANYGTVINSSFNSLKTAGQGFNSAGVGFGSNLYGIFN